jgi:hypothetical protein
VLVVGAVGVVALVIGAVVGVEAVVAVEVAEARGVEVLLLPHPAASAATANSGRSRGLRMAGQR